MHSNGALLKVKGLTVHYYAQEGVVRAVDDVHLDIMQGSTIALIGESGSGKSTVALSIMKLLQSPGRIVKGSILYGGIDLVKLGEDEMTKIRGREISMVFQDPMSYLNPVVKVGDQISEALVTHLQMTKKEARERVIELLGMVRLPKPESIYNYYPHQMSGGMRQRALIAMALSCKPSLIIADEPTTALDVTVQAQIIKLLMELKQSINLTLLLISHDVGVVAGVADAVYIMYAGQVVEKANVYSIYDDPKHPYTQGLLDSTLSIDTFKENLVTIRGSVPDMLRPPSGCRFHPRCPYSMDICRLREPVLRDAGDRNHVSCWLYSG